MLYYTKPKRFSTLPVVAVWLLLVAFLILKFLLGHLCGSVLGFAFNIICCGRCHFGSSRIAPDQARRWLPSYTGTFYILHDEEVDAVAREAAKLDHKGDIAKKEKSLHGLTDDEIDEGWRMDELADGGL